MTLKTSIDTTTPLNADALHGTVFITDNLPFLKALDTESIDLVCIDPPFGKNQTFTGTIRPPLTDDEKRIELELMESWGVNDPDSAYELGVEYPDQLSTTASFQDIWDFRVRTSKEWLDTLESTNPAAWWLIHSTRYSHGDSHAAYIAFMVERMIEIRRILKPTGSVYLHCDHDANAYLRQMMDVVFGHRNFRNEITWVRHTSSQRGSQHMPKRYGNIVDTLLFYGKTNQASISSFVPLTEDERVEKFDLVDENGERYYDDSAHIWRTPNMGPRPNLCYTWRGFTNPHPAGWRLSEERLEEEYQKGNFVIRPDGRLQRRKYERDWRGATRPNLWDDILPASGIERTGYPTQKPQALARRIIEASSNPGDIVLDCFAGCAYVPVAAELTGRKWIACDMSPRAWTIIRRQFHKHPDLGIITEGEITDESIEMRLENTGRTIRVRGPLDLPTRTTPDVYRQTRIRALPEPQFKQTPYETGDEIWTAFVGYWGPTCWYCGGERRKDRRELQLDHIEPNKRDGTNDDCFNRALACAPCNGDKGNQLTPEQTIHRAHEAGRIPTPARRDEILAGFESRYQWAKDRWERIKPNKMDI